MASPSIQQYSTRDGVIVLSNRPEADPKQSQPSPSPSQENLAAQPPPRLDLRSELQALEARRQGPEHLGDAGGGNWGWGLAFAAFSLGVGMLCIVVWRRRRRRRRSEVAARLAEQLMGEHPGALPAFDLEPPDAHGRCAGHAPVSPAPSPASTRRWASQPPPRP